MYDCTERCPVESCTYGNNSIRNVFVENYILDKENIYTIDKVSHKMRQ